MRGTRVAIATQTPLLRPAHGHDPGARSATPTPSLLRRAAGTLRDLPGLGPRDVPVAAPLRDLEINPGGVSRMVLQSLRAWRATGWRGPAHWFALQPAGPRAVRLGKEQVQLHHLSLPRRELAAYARTKEQLWAELHGLPAPRFGVEDFRFYARYNHLASDAILEHTGDVDLAYVHDFQLLQVGAMVGLAMPCVMRWHVPFLPSRIPAPTMSFLVRMLEAYDGVIVSTRRDLEGLSNAGFRGRVRQIYPHSDPEDWRTPSAGAVQAFVDAWAIPDDDPVVVCVARMDPMKRQDLAIQAMRALRKQQPAARLVLIGNGSFSGGRHGAGLGLSKSDAWRALLTRKARDLGVQDRVVFTGWQPDEAVKAAYARADVLLLPSDLEGFGLTPFEAWAQSKPCLLSDGCGASEVVQHGLSGMVFPAGDAAALADALRHLLGDPERAARMGEAGRIALEGHTAQRAAAAEARFLEEAVERSGLR